MAKREPSFNRTSTADRREGVGFLVRELNEHDRKQGKLPDTRKNERTAREIAERAER